MHKIFRVQELVDLVVQNLAVAMTTQTYPLADDPSNVSYRMHLLSSDVKKDVKNLGQVGRIFREPCLNALWYHQEGIDDLLCMSSAIEAVSSSSGHMFSVSDQNQRNMPKLFRLARPLEPTDVPTLHFYASRIHQLCFPPGLYQTQQKIGTDQPLLLGQSKFVRGTILFSRLRSLAWMQDWTTQSSDLDFVLDTTGNSLVEMASWTVAYRSQAKFLAKMEKQHRHLTHLRLRTDLYGGTREQHRSATIEFFRTILPNARNLQELHLEDDFEQCFNVWDTLSSFPRLSSLSFRCLATSQELLDMIPTSPTPYRTLTSFIIHVDDSIFISQILEKVCFPNLHKLQLTFYMDCEVHALRRLLLAVTHACADSPLQSLVIDYECYKDDDDQVPEDPDAAEDVMKFDDLRPLLKYGTLEVLDLDVQCPWIMGDDAVYEIVRVWGPRLKTLKLDTEGGWSTTESITLKGLEHLALHCPRLTTLGIHFIGTPPRDMCSVYKQVDRNGTRWNEALRELAVSSSPLDPSSVNDMAMYLSCLFPNLAHIAPAYWLTRPMLWDTDIDAAGPDGPYKSWEMVQTMVPLIGLARRQERLLAAAVEN
ncbi:hypothetical protein EIP91_003754 [Steccherinum ochraceum]|uniref:F-box domain-containing protein n=1 Tax=Steccherinum ochraceum TaxID=92696 RepID=A0A4R0RA09_9APHY|nr:hypothetical protein EIP91_003754 [Steccherinum ochraceum]